MYIDCIQKCKAESDQDENEASAPHFTVLPRVRNLLSKICMNLFLNEGNSDRIGKRVWSIFSSKAIGGN